MRYTIAQARKLNAITQKEMAKKLGMSEKQYINYEKYRVFFRVNDAYRFSIFVRLPIDQIIFYDANKHVTYKAKDKHNKGVEETE
ncbi:helix-turn-helix transcriptional regulator [Geomicrobium sp. JCM 19038]|uniref:helix-turn-helix transcriptional regulator n=1 Tax=Geomicrobium sp. JCM 19038 TaxID=1460635 RepID=UPI00045F46B4|nr:helix-turn-helix transcriptional regulator [Geomicrobium sp. JCM 19038]GAK08020.1 hypothetical protein JCM19038_1783 [Geomicrobium sp. JCM 19038]